MQHPKPVIFLAFANEQALETGAAIGGGVLQNLSKEQQGIVDALAEAVDHELCELVIESSLTIDELVDIFQDEQYKYQDPYSGQIKSRIGIFHFAGHAGSYQLLLESEDEQNEVANSDGLVPFLAGQESLQLVFLNGCSTQKQSEDLIDAGVPIVVGTSQKINDALAYELAVGFYQRLGQGFAIEHAWEEIATEIANAAGSVTESLTQTRAFEFTTEDGTTAETAGFGFPWKLYVKAGAESAPQWNLPDAARRPLYALPPLPDQPLPAEPFALLRPYAATLAPVYFGREPQVRRLFESITTATSPLLHLLSGASGSGKTSLLQAGLIPRLAQEHQVQYFNKSTIPDLAVALRKHFGIADLADLPGAWVAREAEQERPFTLVIDQLEELGSLLPRGTNPEAEAVLAGLHALQHNAAATPRGKVLLSYRKGYHVAVSETLEDRELAYERTYLDRLDRPAIIDIVLGLTRPDLVEQYRVRVEAGLPEQIADDLLSDAEAVISPSLQILLTKMWQQAPVDDAGYRSFTLEGFHSLKKAFFLDDFFAQQMTALGETHPAVVASGLALDMLHFHTTREGSAANRTTVELASRYALHTGWEDLCQRLIDLYLLAPTAQGTRLGHNTLGSVVRYQYAQSLAPGQQAGRILELRLRDFSPDQPTTFLAEPELAVVEQGLSGMGQPSPRAQELIAESREFYIQSKGILKYVPVFGYWLTGFTILALAGYLYLTLGQGLGGFFDDMSANYYAIGVIFILCFPLGIALLFTPILVGRTLRRLINGGA